MEAKDAKEGQAVEQEKTDDGKAVEAPALPAEDRKPPKESRWKRCQKFMYNKEAGTVMARTAGSWTRILIFYVIFYASMFAFWFLFLFILLACTNMKQPHHSELLMNGIGMKGAEGLSQGTSLVFMDGSAKSAKVYVDKMNKLLSKVPKPSTGLQGRSAQSPCQYEGNDKNDCTIDVKNFGPCVESNSYGYKSGSPCIAFKMNKVIGWEPKPFLSPEEMKKGTSKTVPYELADYIKKLSEKAKDIKSLAKTAWVSCDGETTRDRELIGPIVYYPMAGFPHNYYPFKGPTSPNYTEPFVMINLVRPVPGVPITVTCQTFAKNMPRNTKKSVGAVSFQLFIM